MERFASRLNQPPDPREDFLATDNLIFLSQKLESFDPLTGQGRLNWGRHRRKPRVAFGHMTWPLEKDTSWEFPAGVYPEPKSMPFSLSFVDERTLRLRLRTREGVFQKDADSLMLAGPVGVG